MMPLRKRRYLFGRYAVDSVGSPLCICIFFVLFFPFFLRIHVYPFESSYFTVSRDVYLSIHERAKPEEDENEKKKKKEKTSLGKVFSNAIVSERVDMMINLSFVAVGSNNVMWEMLIFCLLLFILYCLFACSLMLPVLRLLISFSLPSDSGLSRVLLFSS